MKTTSTTSTRSAGSTLLIVLIVGGLIGLTLIAYLKMTGNQNYFVARSQSWNITVPVIEAGLEEALTHLNRNGTTNVNMTADGWSLVNGQYTKANYVGPNYYIVAITFGTQPVIVSQGYTPLQVNYTSGSGPFFADINSSSVLNSYVYRTVRVMTSADAMFAKGMVAKSRIDLNGNNIHTDSFDSTDPLLSTFGLYDATKARDNGDIATNSSLTNSVNTGNANIWGHISTGPNGSISIGPNGVAGSKTWALDPADLGKIQPGWFSDDMNVSFPPVNPPFSGGGITPNPGNYNGDHYNYIIDGGNFVLSSLKITGQKDLIVTQPSILWITGDLTVSGSGQITVAAGASLKLYVGLTTGSGTTAKIGGNGIVNETGNATNMFYYGLPSNTIVAYSGNTAFTGALYAPNADFTLGGGGTTYYDFVGASVTSTVKMNGHFNFHYDENLGKIGPRRGFIATSWDEIACEPLTPPAGFVVR